MLVVALFASIYLAIDRSNLLIKFFPASFDPPKSAAQMTEGDLYGTCAPIEQL